MTSRRRRNVFLVVVVIVVACFVRSTMAQEPVPPAKAAYLKYCSACHGSTGKGDGVVSGLMRPRPTDLTQVARKNKGEFPAMELMKVIDGTTSIRAHGDPDMPVWGEVLHQETQGRLDENVRVRSQIMLITDYLRSIQAK